MQAIILAAGMGKRLGDLTSDRTKCMVEVNGTTLIERLLTQLSDFNLERIVIVIGYQGDKVVELIGDEYKGTKIVYVINPIYNTTNNIYSLYLAKDYLLEDDTLLFESDLILEKNIINKLIDNTYPNLALVDKYQSWMDGTVVTIDDDNNIESFVPKNNFKFEYIPRYYKTVNVYKFSKEFSDSHYVPFLIAYSKALGNNEYYEQVLRVITLLEKPNIKALPLGGEVWYEIDDIQDLDNAETLFADKNKKLQAVQRRYGGYWRYPELLDFCYLVNPYFPNEKMIEEIKANFTDLLRQYPSGLAVNSLLVAKYFSVNPHYITVSNGAAEIINAYISHSNLVTGGISPTFEEYRNRIQNDNLKVYFTPQTDDFTYTVDDLIRYFTDNPVEQLILINPDNPSGNFIPKPDLMKLLNWTHTKKIRLIVDESFVDFSTEGHLNSLIDNNILEQHPHLIVIKSISKSYGVPGLRLGVAATSNTELLNDIKKNISIWNINSFAEFYLQIYGKYEHKYVEACTIFKVERERFMKQLNTIPYLEVMPSQANYFMCRVKKGTATELTAKLLDKYNILIKDLTGKLGFENKEFIRIAVRNEEDNNKLVNALKIL